MTEQSSTFRRIRMLSALSAFFVCLLIATIAPLAGATPVNGKRAAVLSPFNGGVSWGQNASDHDWDGTKPTGVSSGYGFAWDLRGGASAGVYPRIVTSDGTLSLTVTDVADNPSNSGKAITVDVKVDNTLVGTVHYVHLTNLPTYMADPPPFTVTSGTLLGYTAPDKDVTVGDKTCKGYPCSSYWSVASTAGIHTHVDFKQACYKNVGDNGSADTATGLALLSSSYSSSPTNSGECDQDELAAVANGLNNAGSGDLAFVNTNYYGGSVQVRTFSQSSGYQSASEAYLPMSSYSDLNTVPMFKSNGDLVFVNKNYYGGHVQLGTFTQASGYQASSWSTTGMSSYTDPNTIPRFKPNGDLVFINTNYYQGLVQLGTFTQTSGYQSGTWTTIPMGAYADPNTVPMFKPNGDLVFVNTNYYGGHVQLGTFTQASNYQTGSWGTIGMSSYSDLNTVPMFKSNGDLVFVNKTYYQGLVQLGTFTQTSGYQSGTWATIPMGSYTDPNTIPMFK